jgi:hypothetical protein
MNLLLELTASTSHFPFTAVIVMAIGFVLAVTIGSIAWYNSKRPVGWKDKERPDIIPDIEK